MKKLILLSGLALLLTGCAGINYNKDGSVSSYGVFRTMTISYYANGKVKAISTDSTSKDVLLGLDKIMDSTINTVSKVKPL